MKMDRDYLRWLAGHTIRGYKGHVTKGLRTWETAVLSCDKTLSPDDVAKVVATIQSELERRARGQQDSVLLDPEYRGRERMEPPSRRIIRKGEFPGQHV